MIYQGNGLERTQVLDRVFIQYSCGANETTTDNLFTERLLKSITKENVPVVDIFQHIAEDTYRERHPLLSINGLPQDERICLNQTIRCKYEVIIKWLR